MNDTGKIILAATAGLVVGGILGILFAPAKGSETRQKIADSGKKLADSLREKVNEGKEKLNDLKGKVREKTDELKGKFGEYV